MALELRQQLKLTQQLIMTPQLQMAIKLLQLSRLELMETVRQELEENPALEEIPEAAGDEQAREREEKSGEEVEAKEVTIEEKLSEDIDYDILVEKTKGYSGADINNVCREAALMPMRRKIMGKKIDITAIPDMKDEFDIPLTMQDFMEALENVKTSVGSTHLKEYAEWMKEFGSI